MPLSPATITLLILAAAASAFAWGRMRPEIIAMAVVLALGLSGVVDPAGVFSGFGDPTVVTIVCLLILSAGLERTGAAARAGSTLLRAVGSREGVLTVALMLLAGLLAAVMNIVGATAVLLPVALALCREAGIGPSRMLMPLAIGSRQGGALTLVGKPSNLIVSGLLARAGYAPLSFFAFLPVGMALLAAGTAFTATVGRRLLPRPRAGLATPSGTPRRSLLETYRLPKRVFRVGVSGASQLAGRSIAEAALGESYGMTVMAILRGRRRIYAPSPEERIEAGDALLVAARADEAEKLGADASLEVRPELAESSEALETADVGLAEVVVAPRSDLASKSLKEIEFRQRYGLNVVAIWREGRPHRAWLAEMPLQHGDALLLQGSREGIAFLRRDTNFISLDEPLAPRSSRMGLAVLAVAALVALETTGVATVSMAALVAAGIVVLGGCLTPEEAFQSVDWSTVVTTGGLLPLGVALHSTGAAAAIAGAVLPLASHSPLASLAVVLLASVAIGQVVPSVPATIMMAPIALGIAEATGASPVPFLIVVASATSVTLMTPVSHPASMMVMGPGGYRYRDYARLGAPLTLLLCAVLLATVLLFWRF